MSTLDSFDGLANKDFGITYYIVSGFVLLSITPLLLRFTTNIQQIFGHMADVIGHIYLATSHVFGTSYQWYALWREIKQLHLIRQWHTNGNTDCQLPQMQQPLDEWIIEIRQQWTPTPFKDHIKSSQDLLQEYQVNTTELSFDFHLPTITQQQINIPLVVHNDRALKEFIQGKERCPKFINQDLTLLQDLYIPSTFTNVSHTSTSLKEPAHINLPTCTPNEHLLKENTESTCTQSVQLVLGVTPAEVCHAEDNPTLTVPQLLDIELCQEYTDTPLKTLDGLYVTQPK